MVVMMVMNVGYGNANGDKQVIIWFFYELVITCHCGYCSHDDYYYITIYIYILVNIIMVTPHSC
jgi:hypothetical protein